MRLAKLTTSFKKDMKRQKKRGKSREKLLKLMNMICRDGDAPKTYRPHNLVGNWAGYRECHIEPDWLVIYTVEAQSVTFHRTGTYADLFNK